MEYSTKSQVAKRYGFDMKSVTNWINERGADSCWCSDKRRFREPQITEWVVKNIITPLREVDNKEAMGQAKLRKLDAEARIMEMKARETAGTLIPVQLVEASISKFSSMVRNAMLQISSTQAQSIIEHSTDTRTLKKFMNQIITERLEDIAKQMDQGEFLSDDEITQYSEDEDQTDGFRTAQNDTDNGNSVQDGDEPDGGVSDTGFDSDNDGEDSEQDLDFFD